MHDRHYADASAHLALELEKEIQEIANGLKELDHEEQHHQPQCSSDAGRIDLVISAEFGSNVFVTQYPAVSAMRITSCFALRCLLLTACESS